MNSEKVKEIKDKLQEEIFIATRLDDKLRRVETKDLQEILILINELESENELLRNAKVVYETVDYCYEDLKKAEKRIAELEKENAKYNQKLTTNQWVQEISKEALKQFAEMLKKRTILYSGINVKYEAITADIIDETLKEFIND